MLISPFTISMHPLGLFPAGHNSAVDKTIQHKSAKSTKWGDSRPFPEQKKAACHPLVNPWKPGVKGSCYAKFALFAGLSAPYCFSARSRFTLHAFMFEQASRNIDEVLWKEAGCTTELDYTEQTSWLLFLKYLDGLEEDEAAEAELDGKKYAYILEKPYRWQNCAAPKEGTANSTTTPL